MLRPDPETDFLAFSLPDALTTSLCGPRIAGRALEHRGVALRRRRGWIRRKIAAEADVDVIVTGTLLRAGDEHPRVSAAHRRLERDAAVVPHNRKCRSATCSTSRTSSPTASSTSLSLPLTAREQQHAPARRAVQQRERTNTSCAANQLSYDAKQWSVARDLYLRCVEDDPRYAPAWARLGRIHHVMAKYLETGKEEEFDRAETAFRRALDLNPDLAIAHKLYAQLEVDLGRAHDAMARLVGPGTKRRPGVAVPDS